MAADVRAERLWHFGFNRAHDINEVLVAGERSSGAAVEQTMRAVATDGRPLVLAGCGHYPAEEAPTETADALIGFLTGTTT